MATASIVGAAVTSLPATAAPPAAPITLGIHDGAINMCDHGGNQTTPPTAAQLAAAASSFTNKYWKPLKVFTVRFSPPWDIAYHHDGAKDSTANKKLAVIQTCFNAWLTGAQMAGARPEIAFKPDPGYRTPDGTSKAPDIHTYRLAIDAFTRQYSNPASTQGRARVQIISPWGEPDDPAPIVMPQGGHQLSDPSCHGSPGVNTCGPILAAHMWQAVRASCKRCNLIGQALGSGVIAGDFSSLGGIRGPEAGPRGLRGSYLDTYRRNLGGHRPPVWGLHPYSDISAFEKANAAHQPLPRLSSTLVAAFARDLDTVGYHQHTQIWLDEISAFQYYSMNGTPEPLWTPQVQAAAGHYLLTGLPKAASGPAEPTVTRAYYLNFQAADPVNSRWALVLNGGQTPQPIYYTFMRR